MLLLLLLMMMICVRATCTCRSASDPHVSEGRRRRRIDSAEQRVVRATGPRRQPDRRLLNHELQSTRSTFRNGSKWQRHAGHHVLLTEAVYLHIEQRYGLYTPSRCCRCERFDKSVASEGKSTPVSYTHLTLPTILRV